MTEACLSRVAVMQTPVEMHSLFKTFAQGRRPGCKRRPVAPCENTGLAMTERCFPDAIPLVR